MSAPLVAYLPYWLLPVLALALASTAWLAVRLAHSRKAQRQERERLDHILDGSPVVTYTLDPQTLAPSYVSGNLHRLLGITAGQHVLGDAQWWRSRLHPQDREATIARFERWWQEGASGSLTHSYRLLGAQNRTVWVEDTLRAQRDAQGTVLACIGAIVDVTERRQVEQALADNERQMRALIAAMDDLVVVVDAGGRLLGFHQPGRLRALTGMETPVPGQPYSDVLPAPVAEAIAQAVVQLQLEPGPVHREVAWPGPQGDLWLDLTVSVMAEDGDTVRPYLCVGSDMSERKRHEDELTALATTDALTRLPNRRHFLARLEEELGRVRRYPQEETALLMLDLDRFKRVNDTWGHTVGDRVLQAFADVLRATPRGADLPGRVGGEEFALLLPNTGREAAQAAAERVRTEVEAMRVRLDSGESIAITVSIGVTPLLPGDDPESALHRADQALYRAKSGGRNRVELTWD